MSSAAPGAVLSVPWRFTQADFECFAALSGDNNPIHVDAAFAAKTHFGRTVAHGMLLMGVVHGRIARWLNRPVLASHEMTFSAPTYADEDVDVRLELTAADSSFLHVNTSVVHQQGTSGLTGKAMLQRVGRAVPLPPYLPPDSEALQDRGLRLGESARRTRQFTAEQLNRYAALVDDPDLPRDRVPPALLGGLISDLLGTTLPGPGTNWLKLRLALAGTVVPGESLLGEVIIVRLRPAKALVNLRTTISNAQGVPLADGEALVLVRDANRARG